MDDDVNDGEDGESSVLIERRPLTDLNPARYNPRKNLQPGDPEYDRLRKAIQEFGLVDPLVWNVRTGNLVGGHQRLKILRELGVEEVEVSVVDLDDVKEKALNLALNRTGGDWDDEKLRTVLAELEDSLDDIELTGFSQEEVDALFAEVGAEPGSAKDDEFDVDGALDEVAETVCKPGDLWKLGRHRLMCGDCREAHLVERLFGAERLRMVWTDPPYGVSYADKNEFLNAMARGNCNQTPISNDHMSEDDTEALCRDALSLAATFGLPGASVYVACPPGTLLPHFIAAVAASGFTYKHSLVWVKNQFVLGRCDYHYRHETILYGWKEDGAHYFINDHTKDSVFEFDKPHKSEEHPTMKPVELVAEMVANSSQPGEIVYDAFFGSGTTLIACEQLGRRAYGCELSPRYCDVIIRRWETLTGQRAELIRE